MEYEILDPEISFKIYFSKDGHHFTSDNCVEIHAGRQNIFNADAEQYFIFSSDLLNGEELIGDGEIKTKHSDWHEIVYLDDKKYYIAAPLLFRKVKDFITPIGMEGFED